MRYNRMLATLKKVAADVKRREAVNKKLSPVGCWEMIKRIEQANTPLGVKRRCNLARIWLDENRAIDRADWEALTMTICFLERNAASVCANARQTERSETNDGSRKADNPQDDRGIQLELPDPVADTDEA